MFIKAHCPVCGTDVYHNIRLHAFEHLSFEGEREACRYAIESVAHFLCTLQQIFICPLIKHLQLLFRMEVMFPMLENFNFCLIPCCKC